MTDPENETRLTSACVGVTRSVKTVSGGSFGEGLITRFRAFGVAPLRKLRVLRKGWLGGPLVVRVGKTTNIAVRRSEAELVVLQHHDEGDPNRSEST
ncbi:FeoA family protein [Roseibium sp. RKSG952]|uniref:FeoA family protein n=1 Tax=Roseibium sp. RKSG952 TaxID=2529384 RepID=UPI0012BC3BB0|nr:FeoA family protein [Roseibium sp. RKSG952]MTH99895.1 ferrous iron transport protein A [Roseibium sp. RKSG952]